METRIRNSLGCPACREPLVDQPGELVCSSCSNSYPLSRTGVPILFTESSEVVQDEAAGLYERARPALIRLLRSLLKPANLTVGRSLHDRLRDEFVFAAPADSMVLNFGSGIDHPVADERIVNFDIFPHGNTHVVGDGHHLPFLTESIDVVWLSAVLEHIRKPWLVSDEVFRVLKPGGVVLVSVPFVQKRHGAPNDFFRYTVDGLRSVFDQFEELSSGVTFTGPTGTVIHVVGAWMNAAFPGRIGLGLEALTTRILSLFKHLDRLVPRTELERGVLSGGVCYLGRKPTVSDSGRQARLAP